MKTEPGLTFETLTGRQKAAILMVALGRKSASQVFKAMNPREVEEVTLEMAELGNIPNDLLEQVEDRGMWPSSTTRYCTSDHKRGPIRRVMTKLVREHHAVHYRPTDDGWPGHWGKRRPVRILNCMGFRAQESPARAKRAELAEEYLKKGSPLHVEGELRNRSWTDKDGNKRYTTEVVAHRIQFVGKPERPAGDPPTVEEPPADQEPDVPAEDIPF